MRECSPRSTAGAPRVRAWRSPRSSRSGLRAASRRRQMAVSASGGIAGSVSGAASRPPWSRPRRRRSRPGSRGLLCASASSDESAWSVGLACGGTIEIFVDPLAADCTGPLPTPSSRVAARSPSPRSSPAPRALLGRKLCCGERPDGRRACRPAARDPPAPRSPSEPAAASRSASSEVFVDVLHAAAAADRRRRRAHRDPADRALAKTLGFQTILSRSPGGVRQRDALSARRPRSSREWPDAPSARSHPTAPPRSPCSRTTPSSTTRRC